MTFVWALLLNSPLLCQIKASNLSFGSESSCVSEVEKKKEHRNCYNIPVFTSMDSGTVPYSRGRFTMLFTLSFSYIDRHVYHNDSPKHFQVILFAKSNMLQTFHGKRPLPRCGYPSRINISFEEHYQSFQQHLRKIEHKQFLLGDFTFDQSLSKLKTEATVRKTENAK